MRRCGFQAGMVALVALCAWTAGAQAAADRMPPALAGSWRIARILPTKNTACWDAEQAGKLVGSTLTYRTGAMRWQGGDVPLTGIVTRTVTPEVFASESGQMQLADLKILSPSVTEVDLQHEDMDITGSTTEVPGDSVLIAGRDRIVVSACGVYYEATRLGPRTGK